VLCSDTRGAPRVSPAYTRRERDAWPPEEISLLPESVRPKLGETLDLILRAKVFLLQSASGYRANTDSFTLAYYSWKSFTEARRLRSFDEEDGLDPVVLLDLGAGNGLVSVLFGLAAGRHQSSLVLVEKQPLLGCRAQRNLDLNGLSGIVVRHDLAFPLPKSYRKTAAVVACNPPFYEAHSRSPPRNAEKAVAHMETTADLSAFLEGAHSALRPGRENIVCMIHDMRQLERILLACDRASLLVLEVLEVMHTELESTDRVLLKARQKDEADAAEKKEVPIGKLCLHPDACAPKRYGQELEEFLKALPEPIYPIGRQGYFL
jgi:tRNA1(Val) A37 N6-methylase TrmN6